jgi:hypothetical protein
MLLTPMIGYVQKMFSSFEKPTTYGSALEAYIVSKNPQDSCDVDRLAREFDQKMSARILGGWPL